MRVCSIVRSLLIPIVMLSALQFQARAQADADPKKAPAAASPAAPPAEQDYVRPTEKTRLHNYFFDTLGPYPFVGSAITASINQAENEPPEWKQGAAGFGRRFGSAFGISAVSTTTRYALARAFQEDTIYYPCDCKGVFPRLRHAVISTLAARRGDDGHSVFSLSALVAPYAGTMTAVYAWYPDRYGAKDAFRMGNYSLLAYAGGNVALEFLYSGPHSLLARWHLGKGHAPPKATSNP